MKTKSKVLNQFFLCYANVMRRTNSKTINRNNTKTFVSNKQHNKLLGLNHNKKTYKRKK